MNYFLKASEVYTPNKILNNSSISVRGDRIAEIGGKMYEDDCIIDLGNCKLLPGLIDFHIHGAYGFDTMDSSFDSINNISRYISSKGVTSFLATTVTSRMEKIRNAVENIYYSIQKGTDGARLLGSYVEGPYISEKYKGAHNKEYIREINIDEVEELVKLSRNTLKVMTIAPEKKHSLDVIRYLISKGIKVSLGHSDATYEETIKAIECGADVAVHIFNGMRAIQTREAGIVGAALSDDRINVELICDGVHVHTPLTKIVLRAKKKENILLVTDSIRATGLKDGKYEFGEKYITVENGIAKTDSGSLAGSTLNLLDAVKNMVIKVGVSLIDAVQMATINQAKVLGFDKEIGSLEPGKIADIIAIDENFNNLFTMVSGKIVFLCDRVKIMNCELI